jgi:hypothetical protein
VRNPEPNEVVRGAIKGAAQHFDESDFSKRELLDMLDNEIEKERDRSRAENNKTLSEV